MKQTKTEFRFFTIPQWEQEQDYLRQQHQSGWKFVRVNPLGFYHFERCQPEDVVYQLDYNPDGAAHKDEYVCMFRDCGWEYLQDFVGYSYFRKPVAQMKQGEEEIFCDDDSRIDMMKRVMRGRLLPLLCIFFLLILPNLVYWSRGGGLIEGIWYVIFWVMFIFYLIIFVSFGLQFWKCWRAQRR